MIGSRYQQSGTSSITEGTSLRMIGEYNGGDVAAANAAAASTPEHQHASGSTIKHVS
jgi:hypothetical protein